MQLRISVLLVLTLLLAGPVQALEPASQRFAAVLESDALTSAAALQEELAADIAAVGLQGTIDALRPVLESRPAQAKTLVQLADDLTAQEAYVLLAALAGAGHTVDQARLDRLLRDAANTGSAQAQYQLSQILFEADPALSADYLQQAVAQRHPAARRELAFRLQQGTGIVADAARAQRLLLELRDEGYVPAYADVAELYLRGTATLERDPERARGLLALAMDAGDDWAAFRLYQLLLRSGGDQDRRVAARALRQAANAGLIPALIASARWSLLGYLVPASPVQALALLEGAERRTHAAGFNARGADYYLRRIYLAQAEAALQDGDFAGARNRLQQLLGVLERAEGLPAANRIRDFTALVELGLHLGNRALVIAAQEALLGVAEMSSAVYRDARLAYALQQVLLLRDAGRNDEAARRLQWLRGQLKSASPLLRDALQQYAGALQAMDRGRDQAGRAGLAKAIERLAAIGDVPAYLDLYARWSVAMSEMRGGPPAEAGAQLLETLRAEVAADRVDAWPWAMEASLRFAGALERAGHQQAAAAWSRHLMQAFRARAKAQRAMGGALLPGESVLLSRVMVLRGRLLLTAGVEPEEGADQDTRDGFFRDLALRTVLTESAVAAAAALDARAVAETRDRYLQSMRLRSLRQFMLADQMPDALRPEGLLAEAETHLQAVQKPLPAVVRKPPAMPGLLDSAQLLSEGESLVVYQFAPAGGLAAVLRREGLQLVPLYWGQSDPETLIAEVARSLAEPGAEFAAGAAEKLHELLLAPLEPLLVDTGKLLVVPDGSLAAIPLAVLRDRHDPESPWLLQRMAVSLLPDLRSLAQMLHPDPRGNDYLGVGDLPVSQRPYVAPPPLSRLQDWHGRPVGRVLAGLAGLPGSRDRMVRAAALYGAQARLLMAGNATEAGLELAEWRRAGVLQFSLPALVAGRPAGRQQPGLLFALPGPDVVDQDGLLTLEEIVARRIASRLVILDGVDTVHEPGSGQGALQLAQGFARAGAQAVLLTHQSPDGVSAPDFLERFLQHYRGEHAASAALAMRMTCLELLYQAKAEKPHPRYWAPASVVGP